MILGFSLWAFTVPFTLLAVFGNYNVIGDYQFDAKDEEGNPRVQTVAEDRSRKAVWMDHVVFERTLCASRSVASTMRHDVLLRDDGRRFWLSSILGSSKELLFFKVSVET